MAGVGLRASVIAAILGSEPPPISGREVPRTLERLVNGCLEKDRADVERPGGSVLYRRPLDRLSATRIEGTGGGQGPFFSPDGQWLGVFANNRLKRIRLSGGVAETVCELSAFSGAAWGADGTIVFPIGAASGLFRVPADGGTPQPLTVLQPGERPHRNPVFLLDGTSIVFTVTTTETPSYDEASIEVAALDTGA
jgi:serine/threonine-protein kinase